MTIQERYWIVICNGHLGTLQGIICFRDPQIVMWQCTFLYFPHLGKPCVGLVTCIFYNDETLCSILSWSIDDFNIWLKGQVVVFSICKRWCGIINLSVFNFWVSGWYCKMFQALAMKLHMKAPFDLSILSIAFEVKNVQRVRPNMYCKKWFKD